MRAVIFAVLFALLKLLILTFTVSFAPLPERSCITSPSRKPSSTKSLVAVLIDKDVIVRLSINEVLRAAAETVRDILDARASVVSDVDPTLIIYCNVSLCIICISLHITTTIIKNYIE